MKNKCLMNQKIIICQNQQDSELSKQINIILIIFYYLE